MERRRWDGRSGEKDEVVCWCLHYYVQKLSVSSWLEIISYLATQVLPLLGVTVVGCAERSEGREKIELKVV